MGENRSLSNGQEGNVPKLRFPGFEGEWTKKRLSEVATGFDYGMNAAAIKFDGTNQYIRITDIDDESRCYNQSNPVSPAGILDEKYLVGVNDILFARTGASTGKSYLYKETDGKLYFAGFLIRVTVNAENNSIFVFNTTLTQKYNKWVQLTSMRSGQPGINSQEYASYTDFYPMLNEQNKIADFLTIFEHRISKQRQLIETLKKYKRGLLSAIFPKRGKAIPKYRLSGFTEPWEQCRLGELVQIERGGSPRPINDYITDSPNGLNWVKIGDAPTQGLYITKTAEKIRPEGLSKTREVHPGDLILSNSMSFGKPYIMSIDGCIHDGWLLIRDKYKVFDLVFLCHMLSTPHMLNQYKSLAAGSTVNNLNKELVGNTVVTIPEINEQRILGTFLEQVDRLITFHQHKLDMFNKTKSSLIQQLFI